MKGKILFYVQHLLGVGHVFRTMRIVAAMTGRGFAATVIHGGGRIARLHRYGADMRFLPPLISDRGDFSRLLAPGGKVADETFRNERRRRVLAILEEVRPDILITEAFPFGRRQMHFELLPLMDAASRLARRPKIYASIRDILQEGNKPAKDRQTVDLVRRYFDGVLVHGDPDLIGLPETFPFANDIADRLHYTGIVTPPRACAPSPGDRRDVIVSAGGGMLGRELLLAAVEAKALSCMRERRWLLLTGPLMATEDRVALTGTGFDVRAFVCDLPGLLAGAQLSISLAGYNTTADLMTAGCRAILAPQQDAGETEQARRARLLADRGLVHALGRDEKKPEALARAIDRAMAAPPPDWTGVRRDGATATADILERSVTEA